MEKKYQVFVSSTFEDLIQERQEIMRTILELNCIPTGMELFPSSQTRTFDFIERIIDDCDYFILIIGDNYGSIYKDGKSYTQLEYEYAISKNIPLLAFIKNSADKTDNRSLRSFIDVVNNRIIRKWNTKDDLSLLVGRSLLKLLRDSPRIGWIRYNEETHGKNPGTQPDTSLLTFLNDIRTKNDLILKHINPNKKDIRIGNADEEFIEIEILGINPAESQKDSYSIVFTDNNNYRLPIIIGVYEAQAIALEIEKMTTIKPMYPRLCHNMLVELGYKVSAVSIYDIIDGRFSGKLTLTNDMDIIEIEARVSDGIPLALIFKCPILCSKRVFDECKVKAQ